MDENKTIGRFRILQSIVKMRLVIVLFLVFLIVLSFGLIIGRCGDSVNQSMPNIERIAEKFSKGQITQTFISSIPEITSTRGDILEVAHYQATEIFNRRDSRTIFWGALPLGENVVEIRVPATYRYHIRLSDNWRLDVTDNTCIVYAPEIRPSQPPAISTDKMEKLILKQGWARVDANNSLESLEKGITPELRKRAETSQYKSLVREASRQSVTEFVKNWLLKNGQWGETKFNSIKVVFPGENQSQEPTAPRPAG